MEKIPYFKDGNAKKSFASKLNGAITKHIPFFLSVFKDYYKEKRKTCWETKRKIEESYQLPCDDRRRNELDRLRLFNDKQVGGFLHADHFIEDLENRVYVSGLLLSEAICQVVLDTEIIDVRRNLQHRGISRSKIAAFVIFRLVRFRPLSFDPEVYDSFFGSKIQDFFAIHFALNYVLRVNHLTFENKVFHEMAFNLTRRHMNQETIAMVLDSLTKRPSQKP